jgi:hypothetical protein
MVKASAGNLRTFVRLDEGQGKYWTSAPVPDVKNVLQELARLQDVEKRLVATIERKEQVRDVLLEGARKDREIWQVETALSAEARASRYDEEVDEMEGILYGY